MGKNNKNQDASIASTTLGDHASTSLNNQEVEETEFAQEEKPEEVPADASTSLSNHTSTSLSNQEADEKAKMEKVMPEKLKLKKLRDKMQPYFDTNPYVEVFYVTSDETPFYNNEDAKSHQKSIDAEKEVITINK
jgi:hypothetical protein